MRIFEGYQKGINLGGWLSQLVGNDDAHFNGFITESDIDRIASFGCDHVRLPVDCDTVFADMGNTILPRIQYIDQCIDWCGKHGLNLIIDLHKTFGYMFSTNDRDYGATFFHDTDLQAAFLRIWTVFAERYGKYADRVAFELLNEVDLPDVVNEWNGIIRKAIETIRPIAPDTWILVGGVRYNAVTSVPTLDLPYDDKIVYNFHCYEPLVFTHQRAYWVNHMPKDFHIGYPQPVGDYIKAGEELGMWQAGEAKPGDDQLIGPDYFENMFKIAIDTAQERNVPLYCGEYGVIDLAPAPDTLRWLTDINAVFAKYGIGRALWTYKVHNFGMIDAHYDEIREDMVKVL